MGDDKLGGDVLQLGAAPADGTATSGRPAGKQKIAGEAQNYSDEEELAADESALTPSQCATLMGMHALHSNLLHAEPVMHARGDCDIHSRVVHASPGSCRAEVSCLQRQCWWTWWRRMTTTLIWTRTRLQQPRLLCLYPLLQQRQQQRLSRPGREPCRSRCLCQRPRHAEYPLSAEQHACECTHAFVACIGAQLILLDGMQVPAAPAAGEPAVTKAQLMRLLSLDEEEEAPTAAPPAPTAAASVPASAGALAQQLLKAEAGRQPCSHHACHALPSVEQRTPVSSCCVGDAPAAGDDLSSRPSFQRWLLSLMGLPGSCSGRGAAGASGSGCLGGAALLGALPGG